MFCIIYACQIISLLFLARMLNTNCFDSCGVIDKSQEDAILATIHVVCV